MSQCELLVEGDMFAQVVAIGKVYQEDTTLHNVPLSPYVAKIMVERVRVAKVVKIEILLRIRKINMNRKTSSQGIVFWYFR